jgi:hypothetical protein
MAGFIGTSNKLVSGFSPVILCVIPHRQNRLESTAWCFFTFTVGYNSSHNKLLLNDVLKSLRTLCISDCSLLLLTLLNLYSDLSLSLAEFTNPLPFITSKRHRRHHVEQFLCCPAGCLATCYSVITRSLLYVVTGTRVPCRCPTTDFGLWLHYSGFQPSCHNILNRIHVCNLFSNFTII